MNSDGFARGQRFSWSVFDGFHPPSRRPSWSSVDQLVNYGRRFAEEHCRVFPELLHQWDVLLDILDQDPSRSDWTKFRPLRVDREEDWSDWLQHLLAMSTTGRFATALFSRNKFRDNHDAARPEVLREDVTEDRRADLVIHWATRENTHVEVKVGDRNFAKTTETATQLERKYSGSWTHYILLPSKDSVCWNPEPDTVFPAVHVITWDDVAIALRRSLRYGSDPLSWRVWAHGFCGLVEQRLLGHPLAMDTAVSWSLMERRVHQISIMKRGLEDG